MSRARLPIAIAVTAVWCITFLAAIFIDPALVTLATLATTIMGIVVGFLFTGDLLERRSNTSKERSE